MLTVSLRFRGAGAAQGDAMTPANHGYVRCDACRVWRRPEALDDAGVCADAAESCHRLLYERLCQRTEDAASWVPRLPRTEGEP